jgi:deazaflavin-dependent oxidoreductase (nitroreductase family)
VLAQAKSIEQNVGVDLADEPYVYVTTTGRVSGRPRTIEIWFVRHRDFLYIFAEHFERANWVRNIRNDPRIKIRLSTHEGDATARVLDAERDADIWTTVKDLARKKYGWGDGLPVEIQPIRPFGEP